MDLRGKVLGLVPRTMKVHTYNLSISKLSVQAFVQQRHKELL